MATTIAVKAKVTTVPNCPLAAIPEFGAGSLGCLQDPRSVTPSISAKDKRHY